MAAHLNLRSKKTAPTLHACSSICLHPASTPSQLWSLAPFQCVCSSGRGSMGIHRLAGVISSCLPSQKTISLLSLQNLHVDGEYSTLSPLSRGEERVLLPLTRSSQSSTPLIILLSTRPTLPYRDAFLPSLGLLLETTSTASVLRSSAPDTLLDSGRLHFRHPSRF